MERSPFFGLRTVSMKGITAGCALLLSACAGTPSSTGAIEGDLKPCPSSPNCVSTSDINSHHIAPFTLAVPPTEAIAAISAALKTLPRVDIAHQNSRYLRAEFTSAVFRFVDDVEFLVLDNGTLSVRSASRLGYSDLGANRRRAEALRELFREKAIIR